VGEQTRFEQRLNGVQEEGPSQRGATSLTWQLLSPLAVGLEVPGGVPEVIERELGYHGLDHGPEGFAQRGSELERSDLLELSGIDHATIRFEKRLLLGIREAGVGRNAGQVKERMAHPGILPVDQPESPIAPDQVGRQQVVVAERRQERPDPPYRNSSILEQLVDPLGKPCPQLGGRPRVGSNRLEGAKVNQVSGDRIPGAVQPAKSLADMRDQAEILKIGRRKRPTCQVARDQQALLVVNQLRSQAQSRGHALGSRLASAVDPQERLRPANPRHQDTCLALDPVILIGGTGSRGRLGPSPPA
jgi:hypothetical protein